MPNFIICLASVVICASARSFRRDVPVLAPAIVDTKPHQAVVVTRSFCSSVLTSIKSKSLPYWNVETQKCDKEGRTDMIHQCNAVIAGFADVLKGLCPTDGPCNGGDCEDKDNAFKRVKYTAKKDPQLPKWSAYPEPANRAASKRMADGQAAVPSTLVCETPPCIKEGTTPNQAADAPVPSAKPADAKPAPGDVKSADSPKDATPAEKKPADAPVPSAKPADAKPADAAKDAKPAENNPAGTPVPSAKPADAKPAPADVKPADAPKDATPAEKKPADAPVPSAKPADAKPADAAKDVKPAQEKPANAP